MKDKLKTLGAALVGAIVMGVIFLWISWGEIMYPRYHPIEHAEISRLVAEKRPIHIYFHWGTVLEVKEVSVLQGYPSSKDGKPRWPAYIDRVTLRFAGDEEMKQD